MGRCDVDKGCPKRGQCWSERTDGGPGPRVVGPQGAKFKRSQTQTGTTGRHARMDEGLVRYAFESSRDASIVEMS